MSSGLLKALRLIWLLAFICLFLFVGREQQKVFLDVTQNETSIDFHELYHQSHLIAARPVVSIPYLPWCCRPSFFSLALTASN